MMEQIEELIKEYVRRNNDEYKENSDYRKYVKDMSQINLGSITEDKVEVVIKHFLIDWGGMQRVLGEKRAPEWKNRIANQIRANSQKLNDLKTKDLSDVELGNFESDIKDLFESFKKALGETWVGAAKVLHLICPNFFPPWDNNIARAVIEEIKRKYKTKLKVEKLSGKDYYRFMQEIQDFIRKYKGVLSNLATAYEKSKVKIVDDCFWYATQRPLFLLFQRK